MSSNDHQIARNERVHDRVSGIYERIHGEIYNPREQARLAGELRDAVKFAPRIGGRPVALDFGCGAGNLTAHLLDAGCEVISSDVSGKFLELVQKRFGVRTFKLNGLDLSGLECESVDVVATYSVLHHVPDYLGILDEFVRVLRPGGVLYIDHETSSNVWREDIVYREFQQAMRERESIDWWKFLNPYNYVDFVIRATVNPRYRREGDIHVFADDHIEWEAISNRLSGCCSVLRDRSYLLFKRGFSEKVYEQYSNRTADMQLMVFQKHLEAGAFV